MSVETLEAEAFILNYRCDVSDCNGQVVRHTDKVPREEGEELLIAHICQTCHKEYEFDNIVYPTVQHRAKEL